MKSKSFVVSVVVVFLLVVSTFAWLFLRDGVVFSQDFSNGIDGWDVAHVSNIPDEWNLGVSYDEAAKEHFLDIMRVDSITDPDDGDGGQVGIGKNVDIDISKLEHLYIKTNVRVFEHNLGGSGFYDDSIPDGIGEYPVGIWIHYNDSSGAAQRYLWGFLAEKNINNKVNYDLVANGEWRTFVSEDLIAVLKDAVSINRIDINGRGWDFHGNVGGKLELLKQKPDAGTYKFPPSIPASAIPE